MKYLATLAALWLPLLLSAIPSPLLHFMEASPYEVQQMAARQGKLYLIHFAADWCMPSQWMEENTFRDEMLSAFLEKNFLALRANVDLSEGQALKEQYGIHILPSILVFSAQGQLLGRHDGAMEPEALLERLKTYDKPANRMPATLATREEHILPSPQPTFSLSRPALIPDVAAAPSASLAASGSYRPVLVSANQPAAPTGRPLPAAHFTIQAGVFSSYSNAIRYCARLEAKGKQQAEIIPCRLNGQDRYKVFMGRYTSQAEAAVKLKELRRNGIDGFVKIMDR